jgi:iron complex outermembrane receptor protein
MKVLRIAAAGGSSRYLVGVSAMALLLTAASARADATDAAASQPAQAQGQRPVQVADAGNDGGIEAVVVSARLRKENQQDVPVPLQAISGDVLERDNTDVLTSLQQKAPSITITQSNPRQTSISIRGIGLTQSNDGQDASTGIFIDGVYQARPGQAAFDFEDIGQVEVLRGPQGTLFGRNTTTGALNISTKAPEFNYGVGAEADAGNFGLLQAKAWITDAITDDLAFRLSAWSSRRDGFVRDTTNGLSYGGRNNVGVRAQLLYQPAQDFRYRVIYSYEQQDFAGIPQTITGLTVAKAGALGFYDRLNIASPGYVPPSNPYAHATDFNAYFNNYGYKHSLTGEGDLTLDGGYTLTSISNFTYWRYNPYNDQDYTKLDGIPQFGSPNTNVQYSQEFRIASPSEQPLEWVAGAIYFHSRVNWDLGQRNGADAGVFSPQLSTANLASLTPANRNFATLNTILDGALNQYVVNQQAAPTTDSGALFGQATWKVDDRLSLTLGLRASYDYRWEHAVQGNSIASAGVNFGGLSTPGGGLTQAQFLAQYGSLFNSTAAATTLLTNARGTPPASLYASTSLWNGSGTASVSYKLDEGVLAYATFSRGYKSAGLNTSIVAAGLPQVVKPEIVNDYELGMKTTLLNDHLTLNANLFWENYKNYQANISALNPLTGNSAAYLGNIGQITSRGVETDITFLPIEHLRIDASGSYNEVFYSSFANAPCPVEAAVLGQSICNETGRPTQYAPKWIGNITAEYDYPLEGGNELYTVGTVSYRSGAFVSNDFTDSLYNFQSGYALTNLRAGIRLNDHWDLSVFSDNIFDVHFATSRSVSTTLYYASLQQGLPRTFGVTARFHL